MSQMPEPLQSRQNNFLPSAERFNPTDNQTFAHHVQTLYKLEAPISNIYLALSTERPVSNLIETFNNTVEQIDQWLVHANGAILALELDVREGMNVKSVGEMDILIHKFAPNVDDLLQELLKSIFNNLKDADDEGKRKEIQDTFDRINADWVEVKTFFGRVKKEMSESKQRRELLDTMNHIITSIEELNTSIFEYQEQRLSGFGEGVNENLSFPKLSSSPTTRSRSITPAALSNLSNNSHSNELSSRAESALRQLDSRLEPLAARIEYLRSRLSAPNAPSDPNGVLAKKNSILSGKWDALKKEMETLREELKEDRWLGVFKQVTGNASHMMDSLEKAVKQCKDFMTRALSRVDSPLALKLLQQNRGAPIPSRYNQRTYLQQQQSLSQPPIAISSKNFQRLYKSFDAKRKYYVPAVTKMLTMLANGINQQMTRDLEAIKKYKSMKERWDNILDGVEEVQRDMPGLESLMEHSYMSNNSPPSSRPSSRASSPPMSPNMKPTRGMFSPESGSPRGQRSLSPYGVMPPLEHHEPSVSPSRNNARSPSLRSKSPSPRAMSPFGGRNYLTPNGRRAESPPPPHYERQQWNAQYNNSLYNNSHYNQSYNNHNGSYYRDHTISPQPRNGRSDSPIRSSSNRSISPERSSASAIPRPVTSMGIINRTSSRAGIRSLLPKPSTPQPGMASMYHNGMASPPPVLRRLPVRSPTPSSQTSSPSRPITPEHYDDPMAPLSKMNNRSDKYVPVKSDTLDVEVAKIVNNSPIHVKVERAPGGGGRYFFGNGEPGRERKVHNVKLTSNGNKVMVRVGGGWTELDMFLLDHSLMNSVRNL
ncbi:690_t:CDS:1 [Acaulospora morrowiae]|uniref:690_t:CDS:1 n=1 Tax=Acaulospora morrowiae TaxID=94023 RepID=A0A9N9B6R8_9GLOM|nr:690_t:CDS:1 [Acaulospora morrowiae]